MLIYHSRGGNKCKLWFNSKTLAEADLLLKLVGDFSFVTTLVAIIIILDYFLSVTRKLQDKEPEIEKSIDLIKSVKFHNSDSITLSGVVLQDAWSLIWLHQEFVPSQSIAKIPKHNLTVTIFQVRIASLNRPPTNSGKPRKFMIGKPIKVTGALAKKCFK